MPSNEGPWDRLVAAADAWDNQHRGREVVEWSALCDPVAAMLRRQAARSAMYAHELIAKGVPRPLALTVIESDADFMVADATGTALRTLLS